VCSGDGISGNSFGDEFSESCTGRFCSSLKSYSDIQKMLPEEMTSIFETFSEIVFVNSALLR